jgi:hypothetical protein
MRSSRALQDPCLMVVGGHATASRLAHPRRRAAAMLLGRSPQLSVRGASRSGSAADRRCPSNPISLAPDLAWRLASRTAGPSTSGGRFVCWLVGSTSQAAGQHAILLSWRVRAGPQRPLGRRPSLSASAGRPDGVQPFAQVQGRPAGGRLRRPSPAASTATGTLATAVERCHPVQEAHRKAISHDEAAADH